MTNIPPLALRHPFVARLHTVWSHVHTSADLLVALLLGLHLVWLLVHFVPSFVGPDAGALYVQARQIAEGMGTGIVTESPAQFIGNHWMELPDGTFASRFPPGFPAILAFVYALGGPTLALLLTPLLATLAILLVYLIVRHFASQWMALGSALIMATLPTANRFALHNDSTTVTVACLLAGIWLLARWDARPSRWRALSAGLVFGVIPTIRYAEAIFGLPVGLFLIMRAFGRPQVRNHLAWAVLGAAVPIAMLAAHNWVTYGAPWVTGYSYSGESHAFTVSNLLDHAAGYLRAIFSMGGLGVLSAIGVGGMGWMLFDRRWRPWGAFSAVSVLAITVLYGAYYWPVNA